jgi:hypothetical protein
MTPNEETSRNALRCPTGTKLKAAKIIAKPRTNKPNPKMIPFTGGPNSPDPNRRRPSKDSSAINHAA